MEIMGTPSRSATEREEEIRDEYLKTLQDLTFNSKPLIDVLTEVAEEEKAYASTIVDCIVEQLEKVADTLKLPILYLIDSIIKRVRDEYMDLFCKNIAKLFTKVYKQGDETVRQKLLKLRFTWNNLLPVSVLSQLDKTVQTINPNWPAAPSVHVNPKFVAISTNVTNANGVTTTRIAPVSSELINAVKRVRDPRLRKIELQEQNNPVVASPIANPLSTNNSTSCVIKEANLPPASKACVVPQINATTKIEQKNDRRLLLEKKQIPTSKIEVKEPAKKKVSVKVIGIPAKTSRSNSSSMTTTSATSSIVKNKSVKATDSSTNPKPSAVAATVSTSSKEKESPTNMCDMIKDVLKRNEERHMERQKYSKEERNKRLQAIAAGLIDSPDCENTLAEMAEKYPKIVPILISLMEKCKGDSTHEDEDKKSTNAAKKSTSRLCASKGSLTTKRKNTSPKSIPKTSSTSTAPVTSKASSVKIPISTAQIPLPPSTTVAATVISIPSPIIAPATIAEVEPTPKAITSIPHTIMNPIITPVPSNVSQSNSISNLADQLVPTTLQSISVTTSLTSMSTSVSSPATISVLSPISVVSASSPGLPIPPPAPIISSTAAAAEQSKTQDVDYRQLFGFQMLPLPPAAAAVAAANVVAEDESKSVIEVRSEDEEIIDVDALPSVPPAPTTASVTPPPTKPIQKRKSESKKHRGNHSMKKRRTSASSNESDTSKCSIDSVTAKRPIADVIKIVEEEGSRSPETDVKKVKPNDSFYSQITAEIATTNEEKSAKSNLIIMSVSESSRPQADSPPMFSKFESKFGAGYPANHEPSPTQIQELPPTDVNLVDMIDDDPVRSINIDGVSREIRHYGSTAVVFMNWDDPRDISFFNGVRNIIIDDKFGIPCTLNAPEIETLVYGVKHRFRLGVPTRELYVNGVGYECYFGGPPIRIRLNFKTNYIKLEGPPPSVNIGTVKRVDIVAGKIHIIIDDQYKHPVYLDAKPQYFFIDKKPVTLMFINGLRGVLINNVQFRTDFGGPSQTFKLMGKVYQFRFTVLPHGIMPGINLSQMMVLKLPSPPPLPPQFQFSVTDNLPTPPLPPAALATAVVPPAIDLDLTPVTNPVPAAVSSSGVNNILDNISIDELFQKLVASGIVPNVESKSDESSDTVKHVDFNKPETLKQRQPALINMLYSGIQCGSCGLRFPAEQTLKYSQHLDWHFRLNRKGKDGARTIHSRKWYYGRNDWIKFQEMEDNTDRGTSWFDNHPVTEYTEEVLENVPCIPAGSNQYAACELCRDRFEQFYNDESDEWQLRNAIKVDDLIYHPICFSDHQQKLDQEKMEVAAKETSVEDISVPAPAPAPAAPVPIEEAVEEKTEPAVESTTMDYDDDSDIEEVQLIEQPIEEIIINDENDFDEPNLETLNTEEIIAAQREIADEELPEEVPKPIKIEEPEEINRIVDISDGALEPSYDECIETVVDSPQTKSGHEGVVNMDGNIELMDSPAQILSGSTKIKINISKNINEDKAHSPKNEESKNTNGEDSTKSPVTENVYPSGPSTTDTEKLVAVEVKSRIKDAKLSVYPAVNKGTEKSGLCTIM